MKIATVGSVLSSYPILETMKNLTLNKGSRFKEAQFDDAKNNKICARRKFSTASSPQRNVEIARSHRFDKLLPREEGIVEHSRSKRNLSKIEYLIPKPNFIKLIFYSLNWHRIVEFAASYFKP